MPAGRLQLLQNFRVLHLQLSGIYEDALLELGVTILRRPMIQRYVGTAYVSIDIHYTYTHKYITTTSYKTCSCLNINETVHYVLVLSFIKLDASCVWPKLLSVYV
jgi:hypothetical protein